MDKIGHKNTKSFRLSTLIIKDNIITYLELRMNETI